MKGRILKCIEKISLENLDAILISCPANITYLTGFREADGYLLLGRGAKPIYFTNFLYQYEAQRIKEFSLCVVNSNIFQAIAKTINKLHLKRVGFEAQYLPFLEYRKIRDEIITESINFIRTFGLVESLRLIKDKKEISHIKNAVKITIEALSFAREIISAKMSEIELTVELDKFLRLKGDSQSAFAVIVASGKNSAFAHHLSGVAQLNKNFVLIDLGARYYGYCADLTRVLFWGKIPLSFQKIYDIVRKAQELCIKKIKDGISAKEVDRVAREYITQHGFGKYFGHGTGHGIGVSVHEAPAISSTSEQILKEGMVITVEPAIYLNGKFGIRLEDMVLVRKNKAEILSAACFQ
jgi:Xaa-Pro aminopeptidase